MTEKNDTAPIYCRDQREDPLCHDGPSLFRQCCRNMQLTYAGKVVAPMKIEHVITSRPRQKRWMGATYSRQGGYTVSSSRGGNAETVLMRTSRDRGLNKYQTNRLKFSSGQL